MSDRRGGGRAAKVKKNETMNPKEPPTKLQKKIIHWVRRNVPTKKTKFLHSHVVEYFAGSKAVDALVKDSPWAKGNAREDSEIVFEYREAAIEFMDDMLKHKMFHRAKKIPVVDRPKRGKAGKKKQEEKAADTDKDGGGDSTAAGEATPGAGKTADKKKKRKIRLDMHLDQLFLDTTDAYVWLYDPIPWYYWAGGTAIVLGIIAICLFPLWPPMMRKGVHYLSVGAAGFLILIIALGILKYIVFAILFALSGGKLKFWIFPNLTEDVGFLESFMPLYDYTYTGVSWLSKKAKDSDDEEEDDEEEDEDDEDEDGKTKKKEAADSDSATDDSTSRKSSTGKDFEMVDEGARAEEGGDTTE